MKKTAMQLLIEQLEEQRKRVPVEAYKKGLEYAIQAAKSKLETERETIEESVKFGLRQRHDVFQGQEDTDAEQYYKETYG